MEHSFGGPSFPEYLERVPPGSSGLGCAMGGGVMGELGVSFAAAEALAQVCMEELCLLRLPRPRSGEIIPELWGTLRPPLPCQVLEDLLLSDSKRLKDRLLCVFDPD